MLGLPPAALKHIDAKDWSQVRRNRYFIGSTVDYTTPAQAEPPWDTGWVVSGHSKDFTLMPWLLTRGIIGPEDTPVQTSGNYHPLNMLYHQEHFGTREAFEALWEKESIIPKIDWAAYVPEQLLVHWEVILFFAEKAQDLPFRLANLREKEKEVELLDFYKDLGASRPLLTERQHHNFIGNLFKPSALKAALGVGFEHSILTFLCNAHTPRLLLQARPVQPAAMLREFSA